MNHTLSLYEKHMCKKWIEEAAIQSKLELLRYQNEQNQQSVDMIVSMLGLFIITNIFIMIVLSVIRIIFVIYKYFWSVVNVLDKLQYMSESEEE